MFWTRRRPSLLEADPSRLDYDRGYHHAVRGHPYDPHGATDIDAYKRGFVHAKSKTAKPLEQHYTKAISKNLPRIAANLITKHLDISDPRNKRFLQHPDSPREHAPDWHQWGIITHTRMFERAHEKELPGLLQKWGIKDKVDRHLDQKIDGQPKRDLLKAAIPLHDLGKFSGRQFKKDGSTTFGGHEALSGQNIRDHEFASELKKQHNLTDAQVEYIARSAELHFELGILRNKAKQKGQYNLAFAQSEEFPQLAQQVMRSHPGYELEMGLLFIGDSLAKTGIRVQGNTDAELEAQHDDIIREIDRRNQSLPPEHQLSRKLVRAAKQTPVNMAVGKRYLELWAAGQSSTTV